MRPTRRYVMQRRSSLRSFHLKKSGSAFTVALHRLKSQLAPSILTDLDVVFFPSSLEALRYSDSIRKPQGFALSVALRPLPLLRYVVRIPSAVTVIWPQLVWPVLPHLSFQDLFVSKTVQ